MNFTIKILHLYIDLLFSTEELLDTTESLYSYSNGVFSDNLSPKKDAYLHTPIFLGNVIQEKDIPLYSKESVHRIEKGKYLFLQGLESENSNTDIYAEAAEQLWLEALWQELKLEEKTVYMRKLKEDSKSVFQLFRKVI